jgi:hypothetical protein
MSATTDDYDIRLRYPTTIMFSTAAAGSSSKVGTSNSSKDVLMMIKGVQEELPLIIGHLPQTRIMVH